MTTSAGVSTDDDCHRPSATQRNKDGAGELGGGECSAGSQDALQMGTQVHEAEHGHLQREANMLDVQNKTTETGLRRAEISGRVRVGAVMVVVAVALIALQIGVWL